MSSVLFIIFIILNIITWILFLSCFVFFAWGLDAWPCFFMLLASLIFEYIVMFSDYILLCV